MKRFKLVVALLSAPVSIVCLTALLLTACSKEPQHSAPVCGPKPEQSGAAMEKWQKCEKDVAIGVEQAPAK